MAADESAAVCPARDGGFRCGLRHGHRGKHKAVIRHSWEDPIRPKPVVLHRLEHGDYGLTVAGEDFRVVRCNDAASTTYVWEVRREGDRTAVRTFTTLADVRRWAALTASSD